MRYTKKKQADVLEKVRQVGSIPECSEIYGVPHHTIYRWMAQAEPYNKELKSRIYKYAQSVLRVEAKITSSLVDIACIDINDEEWDSLCMYVSNELYKLVQEIIEREEKYWKTRESV